MSLGHHALLGFIDTMFPKMAPIKVGAASVDVRVGNEIITEFGRKIDISKYSDVFPYIMEPGEFLLVSMLEHTVIPRGMACLFLLKSTQARMGMSHAFAGWIDPGWDGILTMELKNYNQERPLQLWPGMPIGQLIYMRVLDDGQCYGGRYQGSEGVVGALEEIDYDAGK